MRNLIAIAVLLASAVAVNAQSNCTTPVECEREAEDWLDNVFEVQMRGWAEFATQKSWMYNVDITDEHAESSTNASQWAASYSQKSWQDYTSQYDTSTFVDTDVKRRIDLMAVLGMPALSSEDYSSYLNVVNYMSGTYGSAKVCPYENQACDLDGPDAMSLEPDIEAILADTPNRQWDELEYYWTAWRDVTGKVYRNEYYEYIDWINKGALANGLADGSEMWLIPYTQDLDPGDNFNDDLELVWAQVRPLYEKVHAYVRWKYIQHWGPLGNFIGTRDPIPAHITGNMWAQSYQHTYSIVAPYPGVENPTDGVTDQMLANGWTVKQIFDESNLFYKAMGMIDMLECYATGCFPIDTPDQRICHYDYPMIVKPPWDVVCHASAWDMYHEAHNDYRIKMCTEVNLEDFVTVHHEMGHIQYYKQYENKPLQYRNGANPGFHEAIGDTMALAVQTPAHLYGLNLVDSPTTVPEADINYLMAQAMERVMFLPFAYTIDQYRWALFNGTFSTAELNAKWWELRKRYQGLAPPNTRTETDFDAGAKYHVAADTPYIRYFVAHILEYQFYKQMCLDSKQYNASDPNMPLFKCDFSFGPDAPAAGANMAQLLQMGAGQPWPDTLEQYTGSRKMDASAILEYFLPLEQFIDGEIATFGIEVGWD